MSGPTPGPWELAPFNGNECDVLDVVSGYEELPGGRVSANWIAECNLQEGPEENLANARLISAAPDLLAALKALVDWQGVEHQAAAGPDGDAEDCPGDDTCRCPIVAQVNAAIAKADGK